MDKELEEEYDSSIITNIEDSQTFYKLYNKSNNTLSNILTKYEKTKVIFERMQMITNGTLPYIPNPEKYDTIYEIVMEELKQKKIPFIIKRNINGRDEYLKLEEFTTEKTRLEGDRKILVERLQELQTNAEQIKSQVQAMGGAIQTCDYFISKLQPPEEPEPNKPESEKDGKLN